MMTIQVYTVSRDMRVRRQIRDETEVPEVASDSFLANPVAYPPCRCTHPRCPDREAER